MKRTKLAASFKLLRLYWLTLVPSGILKLPWLTHTGFRDIITKDHINMTGGISWCWPHLTVTLICRTVDARHPSGGDVTPNPNPDPIFASWRWFPAEFCCSLPQLHFGGINDSNNKNWWIELNLEVVDLTTYTLLGVLWASMSQTLVAEAAARLLWQLPGRCGSCQVVATERAVIFSRWILRWLFSYKMFQGSLDKLWCNNNCLCKLLKK